MVELSGRVAVVTGAARGMGRAITEGLLRDGASVVALEMRWDGEDAFVESLRAGGHAVVAACDVTDDDSLASAYEAAMTRFGTIDIIVNNAGMRMRDVVPSTVIPTLDIPMEQWLRMLDVNTLGPVRVIRHFIQPMLSRGSGSIINVSSDSGARGRAFNQPYGASKAALTNLTQSLADELREKNIAVNAIFPPMTRSTGYDEQTRLRAEQTGVQSMAIPWSPGAVVPLVLMLARQDARVTGRVFKVSDWNLEHGLGGIDTWGAPDS
jgi:NAD(P)-dependent dehydrogenase (short-subunit alcohol dehydrogenase family)